MSREEFMPLINRQGEAQVAFGYGLAKVSNELKKVALFIMALPYPDAFLSRSLKRNALR